jgi:arylsulfatase
MKNDATREARPGEPQAAALGKVPNVLVILVDDMGFGASSAFGGPCRMPVAERLADNGLKYSRFHTTALCSPTRSALLTGRNHHSVGMGSVTNLSTATEGYNGIRPASKATLAQTLRLNGYATGAFGKMHQTPGWELSPAGPFTRWPTQEGFDKFYGFLAADTDQFTPNLVDGTTFIDPPATEDEGYHLSEDLVDQSAAWIRQLSAFAPDKPWFTYLSFGATHAPFQVPEAWRDRYRGRFAHGWDAQREQTLARQKQLGVVPGDAELAPWAPGAPSWTEMSEAEQTVAQRLMEVYAAFAEHTDQQVGRLVAELQRLGQLENTLIFYILGDNGASAEGGIEGTLNEMLRINGLPESIDRMTERLDEVGSSTTAAHYNVGWALAMDTPYQWTKQVASHYGGTRNGLIVHWPAGTAETGLVRNQWHHVIDVAPTVLEAAGISHPTSVDGVAQDPIEGTSMLATFTASHAPETHTTQYFEMHGNRGIYHEGWTAVTKHRTPWTVGVVELVDFEDDAWELYDTTSDWTQARDLAATHPDKLAELQRLFLVEAEKYQVLPLDDRYAERLNPEVAGRPAAPKHMTLDPSTPRLFEDAVPNIKNASFRITARLQVGSEPCRGVLVAQGGRFAGWSLHVDAGVPVFTYNLAEIEITHIRANRVLDPGDHVVAAVFTYDGGGLGEGGDLTLLIDENACGSGRIEQTIPFVFSVDQPLSVGVDWGSPVTTYAHVADTRFTGRLDDVTIEVGSDSVEPSEEDKLQAELAFH